MVEDYKALYDIEEFYQPKNPSKKDGIGHEVEHIKGVILRTEEIVKIINTNPEKYDMDEPVDMQLACYVSALHDIGNSISRSDHNHLGLGIINGELTIDDILSVPFEIDKEFITEQQRDDALEYYAEHGYDLSGLNKDDSTYQILLETAKIETKFSIGYEGKGVNDRQSCNNFLSNKLENIDKLTLKHCTDTIVAKNGDLRIKYDPRLKEITQAVNSIYPKGSEQLKILAQAVQDHNIDFCGTKYAIERYQARNIYGSIVSDADKDNVPETFAIRTFAFALNLFAKQDKSENGYYKQKDSAGNPVYTGKGRKVGIDLEKCLGHILHQANERFRPSLEENGGKIMPIFLDAINYQGKLEKIKPVILNPNGKYRYTYPGGKTVAYEITTNRGDDLYSQLDNISGGNEIMNLRKDFIKAVQKWADPDCFKENIKELKVIALQTFMQSKSIEEAVDVAESTHWGMDADKFTFKDVINRVLNSNENINQDNLDGIINMYVLQGDKQKIEKVVIQENERNER